MVKKLNPDLALFGRHYCTSLRGEYGGDEATIEATLQGLTMREQTAIKQAIGDLIASDFSNADLKGIWKEISGQRIFRAKDARPFLQMVFDMIGTVSPFVPASKRVPGTQLE